MGRFIAIKPLFLVFFVILGSCYHGKPINVLPNIEKVAERTLFIGLDGIDFELVDELKHEGFFPSFQNPIPMVCTFPSATTIGFTGIFQPLGAGQVLGYESRFYSIDENKVVGGTPFDVYKYPIPYKYYFDYFRHSMQSKSVMYSFPSMASKQDLVSTRNTVFEINKNVVMTYLGGTDGSAHLLGRTRTKRTLKFMSDFLEKLQQKHLDQKGEPLRIVLYSDHGFQYENLKTVSNSELKRKLAAKNFQIANSITSDNDIVFTRYGLLSAGVAFTNIHQRAEKARTIASVKGVDLVFWHLGDKRKIFVANGQGEEAYFEFRGSNSYRYVPVTGDPLDYVSLLKRNHFAAGKWLKDSVWKDISFAHTYPDVGYRLYDSFFNLVKNNSTLMFSLHPNYQFGSLMARMGTWTRLGQEGTHGGMFRQTSWAFVMTNLDHNPKPPTHFRYDEMFGYYIPEVVKGMGKKIFDFSDKHDEHVNHLKTTLHSHNDEVPLKQQLDNLEALVLQ